MKKVCLFAVGLFLALSVSAQDYWMFGNHDRPSPIYEPGEKMVFTVQLFDGEDAVEGKTLKWTRTGDDGITEEGEGLSSEDGLEIVASADKPGFVRIYATAWDENGQQIKSAKGQPVFFDGGACVDPEKLQGLPEPDDFDEFWQEQKELLAETPMEVLEMVEVEGNEYVVAYDVKISCAGGMPVSGYLTMPRDAKEKSLPASVGFNGYGVSGAGKALGSGRAHVHLQINAHGIENGQPREYYQKLASTTLSRYGFNKEENSNRETTYFRGMFLRAMRALEFIKSRPEWDRERLIVGGGSQGGLQSLVAAGLDSDVTECSASFPWGCDIGRTELGRLIGPWYVEYTPALRYYDPIYHVKRVNPECTLKMVNNLGDYTCPPSGVWIAYNNFPGPKQMDLRQGCEHGFQMKNAPIFTVRD